MSLKKHTPRLLSVVLLIAFMLAGCLGGSDTEPDAADDDANDDDLNGLDNDDSNGDGDANGDGENGNGNGSDNGNGDGNGDGDGENGNDEICTVSQTRLGSLEMSGEAIPDPTNLDPTSLDPSNLTATVTETISVPQTAESLTITVAAGEYIGQWSVALLDPSGGEAYSATGELPFGIQDVQGGNFTETATITGPAAGDWTLEIGGLGILIDAVTAAVDATVCT